jgi:hypothetical protein
MEAVVSHPVMDMVAAPPRSARRAVSLIFAVNGTLAGTWAARSPAIQQRVTLAPGETRTLRFAIPASARRYWSATDRAYVLDASTFDVWVGGASTAELHTEFDVQDSANVPTAADHAG